MANRRILCALLGTIIILLCTGCGVNTIMDDKVKCTITFDDMFVIGYKDKQYVVLDEEISTNDLGEWVGYIYKNVSGVMFSTVYQDKENENMIAVAADNLFYRAVEKDRLTDEQKVLVIEGSKLLEETNGQQQVLINSADVTQLIYQDKIYQVTKRKIGRESLGDFIASIAKYMVYDTETRTEIEKEEYTGIDWDGGGNQRRTVRVYGNVYHIKNTEELGVEVNGEYYVASIVKE